MFGDRKELILPLVLDIANLVRMAADNNDAQPRSTNSAAAAAAAVTPARKTLAVRESLPSAEFLRAEPDAQPRVPDSAMHDDRLSIDVNDEAATIVTHKSIDGNSNNNNNSEKRAFLVTRSAPFYDHLLKKMLPSLRATAGGGSRKAQTPVAPPPQPPPPHKLSIQRRVDSGSSVQPSPSLNQKPFVVPSTPISLPETTTISSMVNESYNEVEDLALNALNGTAVGNDSEAQGTSFGEPVDDDDEQLPTAEKLIGGRYRKKPYSRFAYRNPTIATPVSLCEKFTGSVCLRVEDYPM